MHSWIPSGVVPTLVDGGRAIIESSVIVAYLDDIVSTPPLTPPDPFARAEMRLWIKWSDDHAYNAVYVPTWKKLSRPVARHLSDEELAERLAAVPTADLRERWRATAREGFSQAEFDAAFAEVTATLEPMESALRDGREWLVATTRWPTSPSCRSSSASTTCTPSCSRSIV